MNPMKGSLSITDLKPLPKASGIYKVADQNETIIYVGQSKNIYERWNGGHHKIADIFSIAGASATIHWVLLPDWLLNRAESAAISFYRPKLNERRPPIV
jgi:excinuclease UvrABC nuclease subunit